MLIERIVMTVVTLARAISLDVFRPRRDAWRHVFMDIYVLAWAVLLGVSLTFHSYFPALVCGIAAYRIFDIVTYRAYFLLVKSQESPWSPDLLRRSILIVVVNLAEIVMAFATMYLVIGNVADSSSGRITNATDAIYFSLVTITTVGYGDFVPRDAFTRMLAVCQVSCSLFLLLFIIPALVSVFTSDSGSSVQRCDAQAPERRDPAKP
jgi:hypothetical protein